MQDFPDDESPWGQQSPDQEVIPSFSIPDDDAAPWGGISDHHDDDFDSYNPYGSVYGEAPTTLVEDSVARPQSPENSVHSDDKPDVPAPTPQLKPSQRTKTNKKKRAGNVKTEAVGADPLASRSVQFDDVALSSSLASTKLHDAPSSSEFDSNATETDDKGNDSNVPVPTAPPDFEISVSDPATVGELTNAHTEYTVVMSTTFEAYEIKEAAVQRRYRDFRWLYRTLEHNNPGIVVPPPPEKQALGRFNDDFVQVRRAALEQMLVKVTKHPVLKADKDLEAFLTSKDFGEYLKSRLMADEELQAATASTLEDRTPPSNSSGGGGTLGFIGSLTGALMLSRGNEADPWTVEKRLRLGELESSLREVIKDMFAVSQQRQQLSDSLKEYSNVIRVLSDIEATRRMSSVLRSFAQVHDRLAQIAERQRKQSIMSLEATLDEHLRLIGSMRDAINQRQKVFSAAEECASELEKKQQALDKLVKYGSTQQDRQLGLEQEVAELSKKAADLHKSAGSIAHTVETEISRVTEEKIAEFRNSVELYLESTIEAHKETIEVWETFYTRNFAKTEVAA